MTTETKMLKISNKFQLHQSFNWPPDICFFGYDEEAEFELDKETSLAIINFLKEAHNLKGEIYD